MSAFLPNCGCCYGEIYGESLATCLPPVSISSCHIHQTWIPHRQPFVLVKLNHFNPFFLCFFVPPQIGSIRRLALSSRSWFLRNTWRPTFGPTPRGLSLPGGSVPYVTWCWQPTRGNCLGPGCNSLRGSIEGRLQKEEEEEAASAALLVSSVAGPAVALAWGIFMPSASVEGVQWQAAGLDQQAAESASPNEEPDQEGFMCCAQCRLKHSLHQNGNTRSIAIFGNGTPESEDCRAWSSRCWQDFNCAAICVQSLSGGVWTDQWQKLLPSFHHHQRSSVRGENTRLSHDTLLPTELALWVDGLQGIWITNCNSLHPSVWYYKWWELPVCKDPPWSNRGQPTYSRRAHICGGKQAWFR